MVGASTALVLAASLLCRDPVPVAAEEGSPAAGVASVDLPSLVDPFVGSGGNRPWFSGNTTPAASWPFGMVQFGPDTTSDPDGTPSASASGYAATDSWVRGFSPTHLSGAGCPTFGNVPLLPITGAVPSEPATATVAFDHAKARAGPGWYRAGLSNGVRVVLVAGERAGMAQLTFPRGSRGRVLVKASEGLAGTDWARVRFLNRREVAVDTRGGGFCGSDSSYRLHLVLRFDRPTVGHGSWGGPDDGDGVLAGKGVGAWLAFDTASRPTVRVKVGVSFVDTAGARRNLDVGPDSWSLRVHRARADRAWATELGRISVSGGTVADRRRFATALYHSLLHPSLVSDADGRYPGFDGSIHRLPDGRRQYSAIAGWDAYRTQLPLLAWLRPDIASDVVRSLLRDAREGGWMPRWPLVASYTGVMNGDSAAPVVAAAHAFGARDFPVRSVVAALVRNAEETAGPKGQGWFVARPGAAEYLDGGYVPNTTPERGWPQPHGASATIEYAVDDFAVSRLARAGRRDSVADRFRERSGAWRNLLDGDRILLLPRDGAGAFPPSTYDPASCCDGFQEGNAVQYTWSVPHDMAGLLSALGTRQEVLDRLDAFHTQLNAGAGRPHAWLGNQPSLATPWIYLWLQQPWRTQDVVRRVRDELWSDGPGGLPGNDDLGGLSAWYVWASLGLYPLTPGTPAVGVARPVFTEVVVRPSRGSATRIERRGDDAHVRGLRVDGAPRSASWMWWGPHSRPRRVVVTTTAAAEPSWATALDAVPPSYP